MYRLIQKTPWSFIILILGMATTSSCKHTKPEKTNFFPNFMHKVEATFFNYLLEGDIDSITAKKRIDLYGIPRKEIVEKWKKGEIGKMDLFEVWFIEYFNCTPEANSFYYASALVSFSDKSLIPYYFFNQSSREERLNAQQVLLNDSQRDYLKEISPQDLVTTSLFDPEYAQSERSFLIFSQLESQKVESCILDIPTMRLLKLNMQDSLSAEDYNHQLLLKTAQNIFFITQEGSPF
ncbi:MAG: hypothetical protein SF052_18090 [Bacteroidia bacterium]|nr:hypothetical protein [Bacteroidia bacterium]